MFARKIICNCCFLTSTIKKKEIEQKQPRYFHSTSTSNTLCVVFSMKKPFSPQKIGRFLGTNRMKNMFFLCKFAKKTMKMYTFQFIKWLHRVERTRKLLEKLLTVNF